MYNASKTDYVMFTLQILFYLYSFVVNTKSIIGILLSLIFNYQYIIDMHFI